MFILQVPTSGTSPASVMPTTGGTSTNRPGGPASDPWGPTIDNLRRNHATELRGVTRNQTTIGRTMRAVLAGGNNNIQLTYNEDGSYSRPDDTGKYYYQADGSIFYSGGVTTTNSGVVRNGPMTLRRPTNASSRWDGSTDGRQPLAHTYALNQLDLIPDGDGGFTKPGEGNTGRYLLQPDGSIFYEGGQLGGNPAGAQTYRNGSWISTERTALPGTMNIQRLKLSLIGTNIARCPGCGDSLYVLPDGRILNINRDGSGGSIYNNGSWTDITPADLRREDIQVGIRAIQASRTQRGWQYP
ncbi:MAG: hypothetical protein HYR97_00005, partial [Candidatus Melainabacteria bacterium]|nr:hypothetical protein [Candidatus Melainabacteria bacterium]